MKKFISIFLLCSFILVSFASCMSKEEKQQAEKNENIAKPIIQRYINENYKGASIKEVECLTNTTTSLFVNTSATDYVRANLLYNKKSFNVVVNLKTGEFYNDFYLDEIEDEIESLIFDEISVQKPRDTEIRVMLSDFDDLIDECWGYLEEDIDSAEELLESGKYQIFVLCKYVNSQMDFEPIPIRSFFRDEYKSDIQISFANYRDKTRYVNEEFLGRRRIYSLSSLFSDEYGYYNVSDLKSASQVRIGENSEAPVYEEDYKHYKSKIYNNIEFIWNDERYDIDFSTTTAKDVVVTEDYSGELFYATNKNAVKLSCINNNYLIMDNDNKVYMYFPEDLYGEYLAIETDGETDVERLKLHRNKYTYQYQILSEYDHEFTLGLYKTAN